MRELLAGSTRFNDLRRGMPNITASMLSRRLEELAIAGIIQRRQDEQGARYELTEAGWELRPVVEALGMWGRRWLPTEYREQDPDPRLLVWDIHRNVELDQIARRTVIALHFPDAPPDYRAYWLILTPQHAEVCLTHPGGDTDLQLSSDVRTLTDIWMGNTTWAAALRAGQLKLTGHADLCRALPRWLKLNPFASIKPSSDRAPAGSPSSPAARARRPAARARCPT